MRYTYYAFRQRRLGGPYQEVLVEARDGVVVRMAPTGRWFRSFADAIEAVRQRMAETRAGHRVPAEKTGA